MRPLMVLSAILLTHCAQAAQVDLGRSFTVSAPIAHVIKYMQEHRDEVSSATLWRVTARRIDPTYGEIVRVVRPKPRGYIDLTIKETISQGNGTAYYSAVLLQCHQGDVVTQSVTATLTQTARGTQIQIRVSASIRGMLDAVARRGANQSLDGLESMMKQRFGG